jgi:hypothetical protein
MVAPICNYNTQLYDPTFNVCVSCRDPMVQPKTDGTMAKTGISDIQRRILENIRTVGGSAGSLVEDQLIATYVCSNDPINSYDLRGNILTQTCDSGEVFSPDEKKCVSKFTARQK